MNLHFPNNSVLVWGSRFMTFILSYVFLHWYAKYVFVLYFAHYGFFSYDFLESTEFGSGWFFLTTELSLLLGSLFIFGWWIVRGLPPEHFLREDKYSIQTLRWGSFLGLGIALAIFGLYALQLVQTPSSKSYDKMFYATLSFLIPFLIATYIRAMLTQVGKRRVFSAAACAISLVVISFAVKPGIARFVGIGLRAFGAGGNVSITYVAKESTELLSATLVLQSPKYLYVLKPNQSDVTTIPLESIRMWSR